MSLLGLMEEKTRVNLLLLTTIIKRLPGATFGDSFPSSSFWLRFFCL